MSLKELVEETRKKVATPTWEVIEAIIAEIEKLKAKPAPKPVTVPKPAPKPTRIERPPKRTPPP